MSEIATMVLVGASVAVNAGVWVRLGALLAGHDDMDARLGRVEDKLERVNG